jgi:hypothetical protein
MHTVYLQLTDAHTVYLQLTDALVSLCRYMHTTLTTDTLLLPLTVASASTLPVNVSIYCCYQNVFAASCYIIQLFMIVAAIEQVHLLFAAVASFQAAAH